MGKEENQLEGNGGKSCDVNYISILQFKLLHYL